MAYFSTCVNQELPCTKVIVVYCSNMILRVKDIIYVSMIEDIYHKSFTVVSAHMLLVNDVFFFSSKIVKIN